METIKWLITLGIFTLFVVMRVYCDILNDKLNKILEELKKLREEK